MAEHKIFALYVDTDDTNLRRRCTYIHNVSVHEKGLGLWEGVSVSLRK
jgi:hypothetical protein